MRPKPKTPTERTHKYRRRQNLLAKADTLNRLGTPTLDKLIEGDVSVITYLAFSSRLRDDLDLWLEATGERLIRNPEPTEQRALECWLWETHDRSRQEQRYEEIDGDLYLCLNTLARRKPNKSPDHDAPWPNPPFRWAPRRWFCSNILSALQTLFPGLTRNPLQMSITRTLSTRDQRNVEYEGEAFLTAEAQPQLAKCQPSGFWNVKWNGAAQAPDWRDKKWEPDEDVPPLQRPPGTWLDRILEDRKALSAKRAECKRRREAAIDGLLSNFGCAA